MKPTMGQFVRRLEQMLDKAKENGDSKELIIYCPGCKGFGYENITTSELDNLEEEWCPLCQEFMEIDADSGCPCNNYRNPYQEARKRIKAWRKGK